MPLTGVSTHAWGLLPLVSLRFLTLGCFRACVGITPEPLRYYHRVMGLVWRADRG